MIWKSGTDGFVTISRNTVVTNLSVQLILRDGSSTDIPLPGSWKLASIIDKPGTTNIFIGSEHGKILEVDVTDVANSVVSSPIPD